MVYYLFSIHKHRVLEYVSSDDLISILNTLRAKLPRSTFIMDYAMEAHGLYIQLHLHGIIRSIKRINYTKLTSIRGFRIHWNRFQQSDRDKVASYIHKNAHDYYRQDQILAENYYRYHYGF